MGNLLASSNGYAPVRTKKLSPEQSDFLDNVERLLKSEGSTKDAVTFLVVHADGRVERGECPKKETFERVLRGYVAGSLDTDDSKWDRLAVVTGRDAAVCGEPNGWAALLLRQPFLLWGTAVVVDESFVN